MATNLVEKIAELTFGPNRSTLVVNSDLPIDVVPNTSPPKFRWLGPNGRTPMEGSLPSSAEARVVELVRYARELELQLKTLRVHSAEDALKSELHAANARVRELELELAEATARPKRGKS